MVKIKRGGLPKLKATLEKKTIAASLGKYHGGYNHENNIDALRINEYNEHESTFRNVDVGQMSTCIFPHERTF
jgi:hypothetical protein